ncbi:MAG: SDR family NAD(P)-dependent oxidoreductase [Actinomycetota bacterium]|nr:SDR family NAD(P)-dependent oxidoreductase [Actinomycetota bacterium]
MNRRVRGLILAINRATVTPSGRGAPLRGLTANTGLADALTRAVAGKTVLITGASSGIGEATARLVASAGALTVLVARRADELERVGQDIEASGGRARLYPCDLTDFASLDAVVARVLREVGPVDVLVNNAGLSIRRRAERSEGRFHDFERPMQLNYFAAIRLITALLPSMRQRERGHIVNISTWSVQVRPARFSGYTASKAALEAWCDCVQAEVREHGIRFTTIRMPLVRTPMIEPTKAYRRVPALTADEAARVVAHAIVRRPRTLRPPISHALALSEAIVPASTDRIRRRYG